MRRIKLDRGKRKGMERLKELQTKNKRNSNKNV